MLFRSLWYKPLTSIPSIVCRSVILPYNAKYSTSKKGNQEDEIDLNKPVSYINSKAFKWQAKHSRIGTNEEEDLWYKPYVIIGSIAVFMIYFCILREESDIDMEFDKTLYSRIHGLEEQQLRLSLKFNEERGLDTRQIRERLKVIEERKQ